ncbi:hypothetical protein BSKO_01472 [Bryopsis sp. KO-2023]|nr:hypothetical protein BSKO_01472 [Bryopsis sp. KO-2023]
MATSKFFCKPSSGSDTDSSESSEESSYVSSSGSDSDSDEGGGYDASKFLPSPRSGSSSDDNRVVKSAKDKCREDLSDVCEEMRNKMKINDWTSIQAVFVKLEKQLEKTMKVLEVQTPPKRYLKLLVELEDFLDKTWSDRETRKKMSVTNAKALNTMRHRILKHNKEYETLMEGWRNNPVDTESESESEEESDSEPSDTDSDDEPIAPKKKDTIMTMDPKDITYELVAEKLAEILASRGKKGADRHEQVEMLQYMITVACGPGQKVACLSHLIAAVFDLNPSMSNHMKVPQWKYCIKCLFDILEILKEHPEIKLSEDLEKIPPRTEEPAEGEEVIVWCTLVPSVERLDDELFKSLQVIDPHTNEYLDRLKDEPYFLALSQMVVDYLTRLGDNATLPRISLRLIEHFYYKTDAVYAAMKRLAITRQEETKEEQEKEDAPDDASDETIDDEEGSEEDEEGQNTNSLTGNVHIRIPADFSMEEDVFKAMDNLVKTVFKHGDERTKARGMMCGIFHKCIHDDFYTARDWFLMSHLQENIQQMDISTQILYNRTIAQMGLCAFRAGLVPEAHSSLSELYASGRIKELLAQGMTMGRYQEKTAEQEKLERRRQMPFHMHINLELLESVHLISAMLLEVPSLAENPFQGNRRMISKPFSWLLDNYQNHTYSGPPENVKDHVVAATKAIFRGDWRTAFGFIESLTCWSLLPNKEEVLDMLKLKMKEEGLRTYLFAYAGQYCSLSQDQLCSMFDLPKEKVHSIVSRMIINDEIRGAWDQPTSTIVMHNVEATRLQTSVMEFADKASLLLEISERSLRQIRTGNMHDDDEGGGRRRGNWDDEGGRNKGGGRGGGNFRGGRGGGRGDRGRGDRDRGDRGDRGGRGGRGGRGRGDRDGDRGSFGAFNRDRRDRDRDMQSSMASLGSVRFKR